MEHYVGLDVSLKTIAVCIVDQSGRSMREDIVKLRREVFGNVTGDERRIWA